MIKSENGITLSALIITIIVLLILIGVGLSMSFDGIDEARNYNLWGEMGAVRQAVIQQYQKALAVGKTGRLKEDAQLDIWIGEKVMSTGDDIFPAGANTQLEQQGITSGAYMLTYNYNNCVYQEDCCYRLTPSSLNQLGIENAIHTYVVNYKTGEVFNETKQVDYENKLLYSMPVNYEKAPVTVDTESFNDWQEELSGGN